MPRHLAFKHSTDKRKRPYWRNEELLGKTFYDRQQEDVLVIGRDSWTRQEVVDILHCGNFHAASNLTKIAAKLQVESLEQLVARFSMEELFSETGFGITTMYVLMCAQEAKQKDPIAWLDKKHKKNEKVVTLATYKQRTHKDNDNGSKKRERVARAS